MNNSDSHTAVQGPSTVTSVKYIAYKTTGDKIHSS